MLKFKDSSSIDNGFEMFEISTSKTDKNDKSKVIDVSKDDNLIDTFITLSKNMTIESSKELKTFLTITSLWDLLSFTTTEEFSIVNPTIVHYYFAIPDRVASVCKLETDEFFFLENFKRFTEESLNDDFGLNLERFICALERFDGFLMHKLVKINGFWDSLNSKVLSSLSRSSSHSFLASLFQNILQRNFPFKTLKNILKRLLINLNLDNQILNENFMEQFITNGLLDHGDFARLSLAITHSIEDSNEFISTLLHEILKIWSNDSWAFRTPFTSQLHYSSCLMIILSLVSPLMFTMDLEELFMNGVQTRLDHSDPQVRLMASCVAESLNQMHPNSENKLDFALDPRNEIVLHLRDCQKFTNLNDSPFNVTKEGLVKESETMKKPDFDPVQYENDTDGEDEDDLKPISSLLKEESVPKNSKTPLPRFLPDCLKVLRANDDCELVEKVLNQLINVFSSSSRLSKQINSASTFNTLLTLNDHFEIKNFDQLRHSSMQNVFVDQIKMVGPEIVDGMFKSNKLVLGQKMELLSIICSSTQEVFKAKERRFSSKSQTFSALDYFEQSFLISENHKPSNPDTRVNEFLEHLSLPLLTQSIKHFHLFKRNHLMFLEKFLWLQAIILNFSQNHLQFDRLAERFIDFIHLTISSSDSFKTISGASTRLIEQIPIQKAILIGTSVVLSSWPASLSVIDYYPRLQEIYTFLDDVANGPGFSQDPQLQALGSSVAMALQDLTDPQKLLKESADQLSLDLKSVKITSLK